MAVIAKNIAYLAKPFAVFQELSLPSFKRGQVNTEEAKEKETTCLSKWQKQKILRSWIK